MSKIAIMLKNDAIDNVVISNPSDYKNDKDWIIVDADSNFVIDEKFLWTIRNSDNKLVHISTNQTSEEEKNTVITQLTLQNLSLKNDVSDLKKLSTAQALQSLQDSKDKSEQQEVITGLTKKILELKQNVTTETK